MSSITFVELESRHLLCDLLGDVMSQASVTRSLGRHLSTAQRAKIDSLIEAARSLRMSLVAGEMEGVQ